MKKHDELIGKKVCAQYIPDTTPISIEIEKLKKEGIDINMDKNEIVCFFAKDKKELDKISKELKSMSMSRFKPI